MDAIRHDVPTLALTDPIVAWRTWTLAGSRDASSVRLLPIAGDAKPWPPRLPASATCTKSRHHVVPDLGCTCGFHAVAEADTLRRTRDPAVLGTVALWGLIAEHEFGYRAAFGYPQRVRLVCYLCFSLWGIHAPGEVEVVVRHRGSRMVPLCGPHLELSRRYEYPMPTVVSAGSVTSALLSAYAVDPLPRP
ncbi:MAG TPA: hypothetical protein VJ913_06440 [Actinomycetota bacterium]|nr:hypothetical protein [Actinomycetota bacterium]